MNKSVALAGFATSTRDYVSRIHVDEVWSLNMIHSSKLMRELFPLNIHRLFDIHPIWMLQASWYESTGAHWKWMTSVKHHYPVYMVEQHPDVYNSVAYPLAEVSQHFLGNLFHESNPVQYFTSSFCYMLALALHEGFTDIYISGFEMGSDTEYVYQKSGAEFWLGIASQHARVFLPEKTQLLKSRLYGFDDNGQIITIDLLKEYYAFYMHRTDELALLPKNDTWIERQMIIGAVTFLENTIKEGAITRQILEGHKEDWDKKVHKFQTEVNTLNAQGWERNAQSKEWESLTQTAFERLKFMYRYDGAYQVVDKLIKECDLQKPDRKLVNRHMFQKFSEVEVPQPV